MAASPGRPERGRAPLTFRGGLNADASRRLLSLPRDQRQHRQPHTVPVSALLLLDLPQERGRRRIWNALIDGHKGSADRYYCKRCGTPLWVSDEQWPELVHPFASAIDTKLPKAPSRVHLLLRDKASWVEPQIGPNDDRGSTAARSPKSPPHKSRKAPSIATIGARTSSPRPCSQPPICAPAASLT